MIIPSIFTMYNISDFSKIKKMTTLSLIKFINFYKITSIGVTLTVISLLGQAPIAPPEFDENEAAPRRLFPG